MKRKVLFGCMMLSCFSALADEKEVTLYGEPVKDGQGHRTEIPIKKVTYDDDFESITVYGEAVSEQVRIVVKDVYGLPLYNNVVELTSSDIDIQVPVGTWSDKHSIEIISKKSHLQGFFE